MIAKLYIGSDRLDLFEDENIEVNSSVASISDINKNTTDYSKSFTVPASSTNNQIFKHYYDQDIDNGFDARLKVAGRIELDGLPFKFGKWKLEKVIVKQNKPTSYTITFFGNLVSLNTLFGDDELTDLDFTSLDFDYTSDEIIGKLNTSGDVVTSLFSKIQLYYEVGVFGDGNLSNNGVLWKNLTPSLRLPAIISAIETKYSLNFSNDLFGRSEVADVCLLLAKDKDAVNGTNRQLINWTDANGSPWVNTTTNVFTFNFPETRIWRVKITPEFTSLLTPYIIEVYIDGVITQSLEATGQFEFTPDAFSQNGDITFYIVAETFSYIASLYQYYRIPPDGNKYQSAVYESLAASNTVTSKFEITNNLPKIKVIDFMTGLSKMFKTVIIADEADNVYINSFPQFYEQGEVYDITQYTDFDSYQVERGDILNTINFKFQEPQTILNKQFLQNTGIAYGDEVTRLLEDNNLPEANDNQLLDGDTLDVTVPFEQILYERITASADDIMAQTPIQYGALIDENLEPVNPKAHLHYVINNQLGSFPINIIDQNALPVTLTSVNIPHYANVLDNEDLNLLFSEEFSTYNGLLTSKNLYSNYYQAYINSIFNIKKRVFTFKANLPLNIATKLELNDTLKIKTTYYKIDNYTSNLRTGETTLTLVNNFDEISNEFSSSVTTLSADFRNQTQNIYFSNTTDLGYVFADTWISFSSLDGNLVYFEFDKNNTGLNRITTGVVTNNTTGETVTITFIQTSTFITSDNNTITSDTNFITSDNG